MVRVLSSTEMAVIHVCLGLTFEVVFFATYDNLEAFALYGISEVDLRLKGASHLWMIPVWAVGMPLLEDISKTLQKLGVPLLMRLSAYSAGCLFFQYAAGWLIRAVGGICPWDYTGSSPYEINGLIRLDYAPFWALLGLAVEWLELYLASVRVLPKQSIAFARKKELAMASSPPDNTDLGSPLHRSQSLQQRSTFAKGVIPPGSPPWDQR
eukprot:Clim_evm2s163 gene=Clim_evmTU2s163